MSLNDQRGAETTFCLLLCYRIRARRCLPLYSISIGVTQLGPNWVILTAIYGVFWPITRHMWGSLPANCVSPMNIIGVTQLTANPFSWHNDNTKTEACQEEVLKIRAFQFFIGVGR